MPNIGAPELVVLLIIALIVFGPSRLPELGKSLGKGIREFRGSVGGNDDDDHDTDVREIEEAQRKAEAETAQAVSGEVVDDSK